MNEGGVRVKARRMPGGSVQPGETESLGKTAEYITDGYPHRNTSWLKQKARLELRRVNRIRAGCWQDTGALGLHPAPRCPDGIPGIPVSGMSTI